MSANELETHLRDALKKLEDAAERVIRTRGYTGDAKRIRLLTEMIREQIANENLVSSARPPR